MASASSSSTGWDDFTAALAATLARLTDRCFLVVSGEDPAGYVQFACASDVLSVEAAGPEFTRGSASDEAADALMRAAGWAPPTGLADPNWTAPLDLPALTSEYAELAARCVIALRDVFGIDDPAGLGYRAWREPEEQPPGVTWSPERFDRLDPGQNPLPLPTLGLQVKPA